MGGACCAFLTIDVTVAGERVLWEVTADPAAQPVVEWFYDLPCCGPPSVTARRDGG